MIHNLGFPLTPELMVTCKGASKPTVVMLLLFSFARNTCYPDPLCLEICYTFLFPSRPTWILFSNVFVLKFINVLLIMVLGLDDSVVDGLAMGSFVLFSLLCMMHIATFLTVISTRASNTYKERALACTFASFVMTRPRNKLGSDLHYTFLGTLCIGVAECQRIMNLIAPEMC
ncbi:hypothetical protein LY76DRAFT_675239 [Colletotrichum caudatum]|nr:hypothetical protein LY76DRAFT_675239 [Colletotrichum caudatum]